MLLISSRPTPTPNVATSATRNGLCTFTVTPDSPRGGNCCCQVRICTGRAQRRDWRLPGDIQVSFASLKCRVDGPLHSPAGPGEVFSCVSCGLWRHSCSLL